MAFEKGTRIRVDITGEVTGKMGTETGYGDGYDYAKVTRVAQRKDGRWNHLLDLSSSGVTVSDGLLRARFDAVVTGDLRASLSVTTQVREDDGTVHYLYLDSAAVTAVNTGGTGTAYAKRGDKVRVKFKGTVETEGGQPNATSRIVEDGTAYTHYLYLGSEDARNEVLANAADFTRLRYSYPPAGSRVTVSFEATVQDDAPDEARLRTTTVRTGSYTHYLYLGSPSVRPAAEAVKEAPAPTEEAAITEEVVTAPGTRITPDDDVIESKDVLARIAELEEALSKAGGFRIKRNRTGDLLAGAGRFTSAAAADQYLDDNDYDSGRFTVATIQARFSDEDATELELLRALNEAGRSQFGSEAWITRSVQLREDGSLDSEWARSEAMARLGVSADALDEWPLDQVDWSDAATALLESEYMTVDFGPRTFWGKG